MTDVELRLPVNALISFHYFKKYNVAQLNSWGLRLIGDSGAFSAENVGAEIDIDEFVEWGLRWKDNLAWVASLDVIGNAEKSWKNYKELRAKGLDAVPTIHYGCDPKEISRYAAESVDFMGLGGMVGRKSERQRLLRWTLSVFRYARDNHPEMRFHGWGITHNELIMSLPWYSVDSSGFSAAYRFGRLGLFNPKTGKNINVELNGKDIYNYSDFVRSEYKINPDVIAVSNSESRRPLVRTAVASVQKMEDFLRKRHSVSTPSYGINHNLSFGEAAPNVHAAIGFPGAQSTVSLNPDDKAPEEAPSIHIVTNVPGYFKDMTHEGPNIHIADNAAKHLKIATDGPHTHVAPGSALKDYEAMTAKETA